MKRNAFVLGILGGFVSAKSALAQVQVVGNNGQIVSTGDVNVRQSASGTIEYMDGQGNWIQTVSNDLQVVSTGNVNVDQSASGVVDGGSGGCQPGVSYIDNSGCLQFCDCNFQMVRYCCQEKKCCR